MDNLTPEVLGQKYGLRFELWRDDKYRMHNARTGVQIVITGVPIVLTLDKWDAVLTAVKWNEKRQEDSNA